MTIPEPPEIAMALEPPDSPDAQACRDAYFAELALRFEGGFDRVFAMASRDDGMRPPEGAFLVARRGETPVGCGGFVRLGPDVAEIKRMWTSPEARGLGVARRILRELERIARETGYAHVRLDTNRALVEAQRFYRHEGYAEIARYNDNPYAHLWFEKSLDRIAS